MSRLKSFQRLIFAAVLAFVPRVYSQGDMPPQITAVDATNFVGHEVVVVDKVVQVALRSNIWLLHLNQRYPRSPLNCVVRGKYTNDFPNFSDYQDKRIRVTGQIRNFRGRLEVVLTSTNQITILDSRTEPAVAATTKGESATSQTASTPPVASAATPRMPETQNEVKTEASSNGMLEWIVGLLAAIVALMAGGMFMVWRRQSNERKLKPINAPLALPQNGAPADGSSAESWKERALAAEAMAGKQGELLREKMIPELTEFAKQSLVQGLYAQRNVLLETQRKAQQALAELEARLNTLQAPLHERIRVYEKRIAELEKEVETQGEEMHELTRATLTLVRQKLEDERENQRLHNRFN